MKKIIYLLGLLSFASCTDQFSEINTNPGAPVDVQPEFLLRKVLFDYSEQMSYEGFVAGNLLGQYFTAIDFNLFDRHSLTESQYGGNPWQFIFENLRDNEILLQKAQSNPAFAVYEGPALVMKSYMTATLTDLYGDIPYSEALQGKDGITKPAYDSQKDIYMGDAGVLNNLDKAITQMKAYNLAIKLQGDVLYNGDLNKWIKLANSLKIKYLMRISAKENVAASLQAVVADRNYISSPADNATFQFSSNPPNNFRMSTARIGDFGLFIMSLTMQEILEQYKDSRQAVYFRPTAKDAGQYKGLLNGPDASKLSISVADYSLSGRVFREESAKVKANIMTAFETNLLLAEAAEKGLISGVSAKEMYELGTTQAFAFWGAAMPADYLSNGAAAYKTSGTNALEQIITQKWLGNIINGYEGWIEYRRTGFPKLKTISASLNNNLIPVRLPYPTTEATLNASAYQAAAANTNSNSVNSPVWWDTE